MRCYISYYNVLLEYREGPKKVGKQLRMAYKLASTWHGLVNVYI